MIDDQRLTDGLQRAVGVLDVDVDTRLYEVKARGAQRASRRRIAVAGGALLLVVAVLAVGVQLNREPDISVTTEDSGPWDSLLRNVPGSHGERVYVRDLERARLALGLEVPDAGADEESLPRYWNAVGGSGGGPFTFVPSPSDPSRPIFTPLAGQLGLNPRSVRRYASTNVSSPSGPPLQLHVHEGAFDVSKVTASANGDVVDGPAVMRRSYKGQEYFTVESTDRVRPAPRAVLVRADVAVWASSVAVMEQAIDARQNEAESLVPRRDLMSLARRLRNAGSTGADLSTDVERSSDATAFAMSMGPTDGPSPMVATAHRSGRAAAATKDRMVALAQGHHPYTNQPMAEVLRLVDLQVDSDHVVSARLEPAPGGDPKEFHDAIRRRTQILFVPFKGAFDPIEPPSTTRMVPPTSVP